jgi:hypothetical protein
MSACQCLSPTTLCGASCVNTATDTANCGSCSHACASGEICRMGSCMASATCAGGGPLCNGMCPSYDTDPLNCGGCGLICPITAPICRMGHCGAGG